ncbi:MULTISPECIES: competence protein CoiA family protein [Promicromonospora]|uniref:Competence protein CoiA family protein n=2 Tax=Promicromonospora TaxID=43676 RepID=A0ABW4UZP8_9MICO
MDEADAAVLRRFQQSTEQMVLAADKHHGFRPVKFPVGLTDEVAKKAFRQYTQDHLVCVIEDCHAPLQAHFRTTRRPGFQHDSGTANPHGNESHLHQMGKRLVARWAGEQAGATVQVEATSRDRTRRPDVTINTPTGKKIAVEVQYASMTIAHYLARDQDHARQYAVRVWLLGHSGEQFTVDKGRIKLNELARKIAADGNTLLWINPQDGTILTAWSGSEKDPHPLRGQDKETGLWSIAPLDLCHIDDRTGILTPAGERIQIAEDRRLAARRQLELAQQARREEERRRAEIAARREAAQRAAAERQHRERTSTWDASAEKVWLDAWLIGEHRNKALTVLTATSPQEEAIADALGQSCVHWKTRVYQRIATARQGEWVSWGKALGALEATGDDGTSRRLSKSHWTAFEKYLRVLGEAGLILVIGDDHTPTTAPVSMDGKGKRRPHRAPDGRTRTTAVQAPASTPVQETAPPPPPPPPPPPAQEEPPALAESRQVEEPVQPQEATPAPAPDDGRGTEPATAARTAQGIRTERQGLGTLLDRLLRRRR